MAYDVHVACDDNVIRPSKVVFISKIYGSEDKGWDYHVTLRDTKFIISHKVKDTLSEDRNLLISKM